MKLLMSEALLSLSSAVGRGLGRGSSLLGLSRQFSWTQSISGSPEQAAYRRRSLPWATMSPSGSGSLASCILDPGRLRQPESQGSTPNHKRGIPFGHPSFEAK